MSWPEARSEQFRKMLAGRAVCVTGGAGFIGGHLAEALLGLGARVAIIDDLSNSDADHVAGLVDRFPGRCRFVFSSILEPEGLREAVTGCDIVFHLAAMGSVPRSIKDPERAMEVNLSGTLRVAEAARDAGAARWVYSASSSAYGDEPGLPKVETSLPRPVSPYAVSKLAGEYIVRAWAVTYGLPGISLRYFNVFGPRQSPDSAYAAVIAAFLKALTTGGRPTIYGDGTQTRDFTPVQNVVYANLLAACLPRDPQGEVVNIGLGCRTSLLELLEKLAALTGREEVEPIFKPARPGDVLHSQADITRARSVIGYEPIVTLDQGLSETVEWFSSDRPDESQLRAVMDG